MKKLAKVYLQWLLILLCNPISIIFLVLLLGTSCATVNSKNFAYQEKCYYTNPK